ncbi:coenzyme F420-0:L-glutamate ligase [Novosphingobium colocasiae]|uniref:coenzyme F420-0:L-glutamate ligase n=1 Tax=Novosphingobium colocasiae TaxID=1256513 RepID=UPI0035B38D99
MLDIVPITGIGEIAPGCDLAAVLADALIAIGCAPGPGDVLVVTSKIVSKAEGRVAVLDEVIVDEAAADLAARTRKDPRLVALVQNEASRIVRAVPHVLIACHRTGHVMANAGIDQSNLGDQGGADTVLLLPQDPDASAHALRERLAARLPHPPAVVLSDSFGRPWRMGVVNVAIGAAGLPALIDHRGAPDRNGRPMAVTQVAFADLVASAAGLVMGEGAQGIPAVLIRGLTWDAPDRPAAALVRPIEEDLFQ